MSLSAPFVRRPVATTLAALALAIAGVLGHRALPVAPLPRIDVPTLSVSASLPGASPEVAAATLAGPLERALGRIGGVTELTSTSTSGSAQIALQFDLTRNVDRAARDVQAALAAASADLPAGLPSRPQVRKINPADAPILILALTSPRLSLAQIYDVANRDLAESLSQVAGVGQIFLGGGGQPAIRVRADPARLAARGLTLADVRATLAKASLAAPAGATDDGRRSLPLGPDGQVALAADFRRLALPGGDGEVARLGEVAEITHGVENARAAAWADGHRAVLMIIRRQPDANIIEVIAGVRARLLELADEITPELDIEVALDRSRTIASSVAEVERALWLTMMLVVAVVWIFFGDWRATLVPALAVPLSLLGTFAAMACLKMSLNNFSLMALTIATGFVVDDAIVVAENIERHLALGLSPTAASLAGAREIGFTIVSITLALLAVLMPILAMPGLVGRLFFEFALTLATAVTLSAVISLTLTPMMASRLMRRGARPAGGSGGRLWAWVAAAYARGLDWALRRPLAVLALAALSLGGAGLLFREVPKGLFPAQDTGTLVGVAQGSQDASFQAMQGRMEEVLAAVGADPDVAHVVAFLGASGGGGNSGTVFVELAGEAGRRAGADQVVARLRRRLADVTGISLFLQSVQDVRLGARTSRTQYQYTLESFDVAALRGAAEAMVQALGQAPALRDVNHDLEARGREVRVAVDPMATRRLGVLAGDVDQALFDAFGQRIASTIYGPLGFARVILEADLPGPQGPESLAALWVPRAAGAPVPLTALARYRSAWAPLSVNRQGQAPAVTLSFNLAPGASLGQATAAVEDEAGRLPRSVRGAWAGTAGLLQSAAGHQGALVALALVCVFIVLGVLYESIIQPLTILSTMPSAAAGGILALVVTRTELSIIAVVGIILLVGIVKKNGIMMVDFALARRRAGATGEVAIREAAAARLRPIVMTTLAAMLGSLPLALASGAGSELRRPLGITIFGGLAVSQLVTLFSTPVVFLALERLVARLNVGRAG